jgi:flagellar M-ring protein FliF
VLLVGMIVLMGLGVRPAMNRVAASGHLEPTVGKPAESRLEGHHNPVLAPAEPAMDAERLRAQEILEQVTGAVKKQPAQSSRLLQSWIHSD